MTDDDVPDSTDWLATPLSGLAAVENALRCQVCKDFYKTPMITTCSHTFCSLCIRRALSNDGKCPLCRKSEQEMKLRSNWSLEETVDAFVRARTTILDLARNGAATASVSKRKAEIDSSQTSDAPEGKRLRTSARLRKSQVEKTPVEAIQDEYEQEVVEVPDDDEYVPEPEDGLVSCPVCQSRMKEWQVFKHLESCTGPTPKKQKSGPSSSGSNFRQLQPQQSKPDRLPAINYSMLKEQALRKKLAELGISNQGPRHLLEKRHKEWITLWNANCDGARPKKRHELLQDLEIWERTQGGRVAMGRSFQSVAMVKDKDFDGDAWAFKHDSSFKDLIASARRSRMEAKKKVEEASKSPSIASPPAAGLSEPSQQGAQLSGASQAEKPGILATKDDKIGIGPSALGSPRGSNDNPKYRVPPHSVAMRTSATSTSPTSTAGLGASPSRAAQAQEATTITQNDTFDEECPYEETTNYHMGMSKEEFERICKA